MTTDHETRARDWLHTWGFKGSAWANLLPSLAALIAAAEERGRVAAVEACIAWVNDAEGEGAAFDLARHMREEADEERDPVNGQLVAARTTPEPSAPPAGDLGSGGLAEVRDVAQMASRDAAEAVRERDDARAALARLRTELHSVAVRIEPYEPQRDGRTWFGCASCNCAWPEGEPEDHGAGCLAAKGDSRHIPCSYCGARPEHLGIGCPICERFR